MGIDAKPGMHELFFGNVLRHETQHPRFKNAHGRDTLAHFSDTCPALLKQCRMNAETENECYTAGDFLFRQY